MAVLPFAEWAPDRPDLAETTRYASGVIARTPDSYGPLRTLAPFSSNALPTQCLGAGAQEDAAEQVHVFAGVAADLLTIPYGSQAWESVGGGSFTTAIGENWRFAQFGSIVLATNYSDAIQAYTLGSSSSFGVLSADAPKARHIAVAKTFTIVANTTDPVGGTNPSRVWWSASNDPTSWPIPGSALAQQSQSDYNDINGPMGGITGLTPNLAGCDCAVFFERGVFRMNYVGPPDVFDFYPAAAVKGVPAPNSLVPFNSTVFGLFEDGFYMFDGNQAIPIGADKIDQWFFANANLTALNNVIGAADIASKSIVWLFQSIGAVTNQPDMALIYRWDIQRWTNAPIAAQWITRIPVPDTFSGLPPSVVPLAAGQLQLGAISPAQSLAYFSGPYFPAQIGTKAVQITPGWRSFVRSVRPLVDGGAPSQLLTTESGINLTTEDGIDLITESDSPTITIAMSARGNYQEVESFGPAIGIDAMGECPQRSEGRYHRALVNITSGLWNFAYGADLTAIRSGQR